LCSTAGRRWCGRTSGFSPNRCLLSACLCKRLWTDGERLPIEFRCAARREDLAPASVGLLNGTV
jgi:hypothetical protein